MAQKVCPHLLLFSLFTLIPQTDIETVTLVDVLRRAGAEVSLASVESSTYVRARREEKMREEEGR